MFADYVARILRRDWTFGLGPIKGKKYDQLSPDELAQSIASTNASLKQLAEEIATLNGLEVPLTHRNFLEAQHACQGVADLPEPFWRYDEMCAAGGSDNPLSHFKPDGKIGNGLAHKFRGVVLLEGDLVIRERVVNEPAGPAIPGAGNPNPPANGGRIIYINRAGDVIGSCAVGIVVSNISARSGTTLGSGSCYVQKLTDTVVSTSTTETVLNPHDYAISSGTYVMLGQVPRQNGSKVYVIVEVDGVFPPTYAVRNNTDNQSLSDGTTATVVLDTPIHTEPNGTSVFELATSELTVKQSGYYTISYVVPVQSVSASASGFAWLEEGNAQIPGSRAVFEDLGGSGEVASVSHSINHKVDVSGGNKVYRLRVNVTDGVGACLIRADATYGYARLDIYKTRSL